MRHFAGPVVDHIKRVRGTLHSRDPKEACIACREMLFDCLVDPDRWEQPKLFEERFNASTGIKQLLDSERTQDQVWHILEVVVFAWVKQRHRVHLSLPIEETDQFLAISTTEVEERAQKLEEAAEILAAKDALHGLPDGSTLLHNRHLADRVRWHADRYRAYVDHRAELEAHRKRPNRKPYSVLRLMAEEIDETLADQPVSDRDEIAATLYLDFFGEEPATEEQVAQTAKHVHGSILKTSRRLKRTRLGT